MSDNSETPLTVTTDPEGPAHLSIGPNTVTYTVTDQGGRTATCDIEVTINGAFFMLTASTKKPDSMSLVFESRGDLSCPELMEFPEPIVGNSDD